MKELLCRVEKATSARNKDFLKALDIYSKNVPNNVKTEQNQLSQYVTKKYGKNKREMVFYVLYVGNIVIGYAEIGVLFTSKVFFIDYFILDKEYQSNTYFYALYNLVLLDLKEKYKNIKYIIVENYLNDDVPNSVERFSKKCLALENYQIIDIQYKQPSLDEYMNDSIVQCQLLIKETSDLNGNNTISKEFYLELLNDIYFNHYYEWFTHFFTKEKLKEYYDNLENMIIETEKIISPKIKLKNYTYINCQYYNIKKCTFNENKSFKLPKKSKMPLFILVSIVFLLISICIAVGTYYLLAKVFKLDGQYISIIATLSATMVSIIGSIISAKVFNQ